ncbi:MAG: NTP transferase domain-containing protein [Candidatus Zixiibacteriota bacterium]|nr:MAG: NTP transferase domain-containing protein [candidate division Zixibacteria bacterium]
MTRDADKIALILAAGKGKRMKSDLPKVLHRLDGRYIVDYVIDAARKAGIDRQILVIGHKAEQMREAFAGRDILLALQAEQLGTGHAVMMAREHLRGFSGDLVILCGDMPLVKPETIKRLVEERRRLKAAAVVLTVSFDDPGKYGRIVRDEKGLLKAIVEYRDADKKVRKIKEINTGAYCFDWQKLEKILDRLNPDNDQKEYYLTDSISLFVRQGETVGALVASDPCEGYGINSLEELDMVETLIKNGTR